jgi:hypothetical protein
MQVLPSEVLERIIGFSDERAQWSARSACRLFRQHVEDRVAPQKLLHGGCSIPGATILMFNGFHSYRSEMYLSYAGILTVLNPKADLEMLYARFAFTKPLKNFRINRIDDVEAPLAIRRSCTDLPLIVAESGKAAEEEIFLSKQQLRRHLVVSEDGQALLVPLYLLWTREFELHTPPAKPLEPWVGHVGQLFLYGVPSQDWQTTFLSGANQPI